jgi:hypothetical protein
MQKRKNEKRREKETKTLSQKRKREDIYLKQLPKRCRAYHQVCPRDEQLGQTVGSIEFLHHLIHQTMIVYKSANQGRRW